MKAGCLVDFSRQSEVFNCWRLLLELRPSNMCHHWWVGGWGGLVGGWVGG